MNRLESIGVVYGALLASGVAPSATLLRELRGLVTGPGAAAAALEALREGGVAGCLASLRVRSADVALETQLAASIGIARAERRGGRAC